MNQRRQSRPPRRSGLSQREATLLLPQLYDLWHMLVSEPEAPYLDRWLSRTLGALEKLSREKRLWLGARLIDGVRFAWLALLCHEAQGLGPHAAVIKVRDGVDDLDEAWRMLGGLDAEELFFWVFLRIREDGAHPPRLDEPSHGAVNEWHRIKTGLLETPGLRESLAWAGLPTWVAPELKRRAALAEWSVEERTLFLHRQGSRPPLWLRLNDPASLSPVNDALKAAGFATRHLDGALAVTGDRGIHDLPCYKDGLVEIQDLASQAIGRAVAVEPGQFVWDCCAGGGGKSLQLAAMMAGTGSVYATDINERALADLKKRAKRAGINNVRAYPWDGEALPDFGKSVSRRGGFDRVLVDAPCSGTGTWRRNPDGRLRGDLDEVAELVSTQLSLLTVAAGGVKPGGLLVYATCSWLPMENEDVVAAFLEEQAGFGLVEMGMQGNPGEDADATFFAVLKRMDGSA